MDRPTHSTGRLSRGPHLSLSGQFLPRPRVLGGVHETFRSSSLARSLEEALGGAWSWTVTTNSLWSFLFSHSFLPCSERPSGRQEVWEQVLSGPRSPFHLRPRVPAGGAQQCGVSSQRHLDRGAAPLQRSVPPPRPGAGPCWGGSRIPQDTSHLIFQPQESGRPCLMTQLPLSQLPKSSLQSSLVLPMGTLRHRMAETTELGGRPS